ncbi:MAG: hypothetical protein UH084_03890 [Paludibacteraceae bacterium]|nr:hypothetical protein [Paludibacteraceae bacterium]
MKKIFLLIASSLFIASCQRPNKPQVFGLYIDGTFEEFMEQAHGYHFPITIDTNTIQHISEKEIAMQAYFTEVIDTDAEIIETDTININIQLENQRIYQFSYTLEMPVASYNAIRQACNRIYGSCGYCDVTEYSHACCWMIGKDCLWLVYDISEQQTKYTCIIN